jgi:deferrochelatase/peroxidase EfeB
MRCPFGAHIRRANPRDTFGANDDSKLEIVNRHRILRIGRPYVPSRENGRPGLMFMCLNADIERQFEFLQGTWIQNGDFQGLSGERDPLTGSGARCGGFTIPTPAGPLTVGGMQDFVRVLGGGYFFMPGRSALTFLANPLSGGGRDRDPAPSA